MTAGALQAVVQAAVDATAASAGWVLTVSGDRAEVVAAAGDGAGVALGVSIDAGRGPAGFVLASGQPLAVAPHPDDPMADDGVAAAMGRRPASVLCVPCGTDEAVLGALQLIDKAGGGPFSFDDVEIATLLAGIGGAALAEGGRDGSSIPEPAQLGGELARLAHADPGRYAVVATAIAALLSGV